MKRVIYDAGPLIAADRSERSFWAEHGRRLSRELIPIVPTVVVAQVSRSRRQVQLRRLLAGCIIAALDEQTAHRIGELLAKSGTRDVVDAAVVVVATSLGADIVTSDRADIERLVALSRPRVRVVDT